jgi:inner membrane protein
MDSITHTLAGWTLARAGVERLGLYTTPTLLVAANMPDIGFLHLVAGPAAFLNYGAWTHSVLGATVLGTGVGWAFWRWGRRRAAGLRSRGLLLAGALGTWIHLLLDWVTPAGASLLWPFSRRYYALDWFSLLDMWVLTFLLLGLALPALFRLISEEIGARRSRAGIRWGARLALVACVLVGGGRAILHERAVTQLESRLYKNRSPVRAAAFPTPLNPFRWQAVVETADTFELVELILAGPRTGLEPLATRFKPQPSPMLQAALATPSARSFLAWARFPWAKVVPTAAGDRVELQDLRYTRSRPATPSFVLQIEMNRQGDVEEEKTIMVWSAD